MMLQGIQKQISRTRSGPGKKVFAAAFCAALLCVNLLSGTASAAVLVALDLADIVEQTAPSVVEVFTETKQVSRFFREYVTEGAGSGVILTSDGYIVTNHHVVDGATAIKVRLSDGTACDAALQGTDAKTDLAVLKIDASNLTPAKLADSSKARPGDFVIAIGNPLGELGGTVTEGIVSAMDREITIDGETMTLMQTSAAVNPGNSGGGLFNLDGELIGVVNSKSSGSGIEGLAFAIPSNTVSEITDELMQHGYVTGRPQLRIRVAQVTAPGVSGGIHFDRPGVYILQADDGSGLKTGDRLLRIDGTTIAETGDISAVLERRRVGDTVKVDISREGREVGINVTLTEKKPA